MVYTISFINNYPIINDGSNLLLIDTGAPVSFSSTKSININNNSHEVSASYHGVGVEVLHDNISADVNGLVGMDILSQYRVAIDYPNAQITFGYEDQLGEQIGEIKSLSGAIVNVELNGVTYRMILDTGAPISYAPNEAVQNLQSLRSETDFSPLINQVFTTPIYY